MDLARRHPLAVAFAAYVAIAVLATWPLLPRFGSEIAGQGGDGWQALWSFWWWGESVARRTSPFFSDALRWPAGVSLWAHTSNVPAAVALLPFWAVTPHLPEVALYNLILFASFPLAGCTAYLLARELWGEPLAAFLAGALYAFSAHHFAAAGHLDAVSIEWVPLYFLGLVRTFRRHGPGPPLLAGAALALAAATSPYHLASCAVGTGVLVVAWWRTEPRALTAPDFLRRAALLSATFLALAGWLYRALLPAGSATPAVPAAPGAVDLLAFLVRDGRAAGAAAGPFAGAAISPAYVGYLALALAVVAATRARASRPWFVIAAAGAVLAVGARVHVAGVAVTPAILPVAWLTRAFPGLAATSPARFTCLVAFGISIAAGAALAQLVRAHRRGAAIAIGVAALALVESWPGALRTSSWPAPRFLRDLARDGERWAVLDATAADRQLWHQVLHRHPQLGAALSVTASEATVATGNPVLDALLDRAVSSLPAGTAVQRQDAVRALQQMNVRFVIADDATLGAARALRLPRAYAGDGIVVFEVPPPTG